MSLIHGFADMAELNISSHTSWSMLLIIFRTGLINRVLCVVDSSRVLSCLFCQSVVYYPVISGCVMFSLRDLAKPKDVCPLHPDRCVLKTVPALCLYLRRRYEHFFSCLTVVAYPFVQNFPWLSFSCIQLHFSRIHSCEQRTSCLFYLGTPSQ